MAVRFSLSQISQWWVIPYSGYFSCGKIFVDVENVVGSWKKFHGYVYACTNGRGSLYLW